MKRAAFLFIVPILLSALPLGAEPLPEPALPRSGAAVAASGAEVLPAPVFDPALRVAGTLPELWAESPEPAGVDAFDPAARLAELWSLEPEPRDFNPLSPFVLAPELWADGPAPAEFIDFSAIAAYVQATSTDAAASAEDAVVLRGLLNNEHYRESVRYKKMAEKAFDEGDYDASVEYAAKAGAAARRSDEYVALRLKIRATDQEIAKAKQRLDWAASVGAERSYSGRYAAAKAAYEGALAARNAEQYDLAIDLARKVLSELATVQETAPLPQRYKVRPWAQTKDCFWTISGYPFVYGDPTKWKLLYEANKAKLPRPNNPDLVYVGTVLTIPSIRGEFREGTWEPGKTYSPLPGR